MATIWNLNSGSVLRSGLSLLFLQQYRHYQSNMHIFHLKPSQFSKTLDELLMFLAQVAHCYPDETKDFALDIRDALQRHCTVLDRTLRMTFCQALILLRNKGLIAATSVLELFFEMFRVQDKLLRKTLYTYIVSDIKTVNQKHKNAKLNTTLQNFMYTMLKDNNPVAAKMSLDVMIELYRRNIWKDTKTVNVITTACFSKVTKILVAGLKFFLGTDEEEDHSDSESDQDEQKTSKELLTGFRVGKKTRKRQKKLKRALQNIDKHKKSKKKSEVFNFSALHLIHDPQGFCERLFRQLEGTTERFEVKLMMADLVSRLIGVHQLFLFSFYPYIQRFLQPHQREVTRLLLFAAQSSHDLVPPEIIEGVIRTIANNFITDRNSGEVMAVGLNAVREICFRCPLAISEDALHDFSEYKTHKDKSVMMAARSLIQLYRKTNPDLLRKKDKGKPTEAAKDLKVLQYGERDTHSYIPGAEVLKATEDIEEEEEEQEAWESCSEEEEGSEGEWIDVHHSSDEEGNKVDDSQVPATREEQVLKAQQVSTSRILTQEEFRKVQQIQAVRQTEGMSAEGLNNKKRKRELEEEEQDRGELLQLSMIENVHKKKAHDKDSRLATVMAGREDRPKYTHGPQKMNPHASTTNKDKARKKNYTMIKHKVMNKKNKRSFRDKQIALRNSLLKKQKAKH
ncbi:protein SDA1 homolog isoform X6 [Dreissena polymorpha]|uniref:protein SDA1 homolog isoform X5 n=1 Tax=Dreissena polymorpha TaxID=45954 RepID=UPI0022655557|nr:protein SDA1 homolog isoform X5 [Dreissena polymorpha]XP_052282349.1 protein SDA1 homolog isoform X6 [Dreissena polymorpha]